MEGPRTVEVGATVIATDGEVGTVEEVVPAAVGGGAERLIVRMRDDRRVEVPLALVDPASSAREVRLSVASDSLTAGMTALNAVGDHLTVPVREEVLVPSTHQVELGSVRFQKRVETVPVETTVDVKHDRITVERVALDRPIDAVPAPRHEGDTLIIPVVEEVLVTEKRLVLREEVRITRTQVSESVAVRDTVRREVVDIDESSVESLPDRPAAASPTTDAGDSDELP